MLNLNRVRSNILGKYGRRNVLIAAAVADLVLIGCFVWAVSLLF